jgi:hypothetical protein
MKNNKFK